MLHFDYDWDLNPDGIKLDPELNVDRLGWKGGDYFKLINVNGRAMLIKVDALEKFIVEGAKQNEQMGQLV
jgi:hypothetical protein